MSKKIIILYLQFILLSLSLSDKIIPISLGETIKGEFPLDESHRYYSLTIPKEASKNLLIIKTHEDSAIKSDMKDAFSDPDFYISKKNKYPSSRRSSEWFSEQYGSDIMSIPSEAVNENDVFYIGMYCQYKCRYFLKIEIGKESEINLGEYYNIKLKPYETMNYKIKIKQDFEKLKVLSYSFTNGKFRIFMNKNSPSSANTYKVIPCWDTGYAIIIKRSNIEQYCTNCEYHIIVSNGENEDSNKINDIYLLVSTEEKYESRNLNKLYPIFDALEMDSKTCFNFNITQNQKLYEKLIIDLVVYSGEATLLIEGWKNKNINNKIDADKEKYSYNIIMEKHIILNKADFEFFDKENNNENNYINNENDILHLCLFSSQQISYKIQAYFLSDFNKIQHSSMLAPGYKFRTYLLKDQIIAYELLVDHISKSEYDIETNITVVQNLVVGKTTLYGYYCQDEICNITKKTDFEKIEKNNEFIKSNLNNINKNDPYTNILYIPYKENICIKNPKIKTKNGNLIDCLALAVIKCDTPSEENDMCVFDIQLQVKDQELIMKSKQVYNGMLPLGKIDIYKIIISDENIKDLFIVLNSETGNAQLSVYMDTNYFVFNKQSLISVSNHNDYIPDVVRVTPKKIGKNNLVGTYTIKVSPETFSSYKIYYYTLYNKKENEENNINNLLDVTMNLIEGQLILDFFPNDIRYKIYSYYPMLNKKSTIKIFINRVNIDFDIYAFTDISKFEIMQLHDLKKTPNSEHIKGYQWKSNTNNEIIIKKDDPNFSLNKLLYIIVAPSNPLNFTTKINNENTSEDKLISKFYIGIISEDIPFTITEGMPHTMTLSNSYSQQMYLRVHSNSYKNLNILINLLLGEIDIFASTDYFTPDDINKLDIDSAKYDSKKGTYTLNNFLFKLKLNSFTNFEIDTEFIYRNKKIKIIMII